MSHDSSITKLLLAALVIMAGLFMVMIPNFFRNEEVKEHKARVREREERGSDTYFEELRSLKTYGPKSAKTYRLFGLLFVISGGVILASQLNS